MNKKWKSVSVVLAGLFICGISTTFTSCKDYDDDIDQVNQRIDELAQDLDNLQKDFGAIAYVQSVSFSNGVLTVVGPNGTTSYDIPDNNTTYSLETSEENGKVTVTLKGSDGSSSVQSFDLPSEFDGKLLSIDENRQILYNNIPTGATLPEDKTGEDFKPGNLKIVDGVIYYGDTKTSATLNEFNPKYLTVENGKILYNGVETNVKLPETAVIPDLSVTEIKDGNGVVTGYALTYGDKTTNLKLMSAKLEGLVFIPEFYYQGIEAMGADAYVYNKLALKYGIGSLSANADENKDYADDQYTSGAEVAVTPKLVAQYHLNPSNVSADQLKKENMSFIIEDKAYTKAGNAPKATIVDAKVSKGVLTVTATLNDGMVKSIDEGEVTVMALQVGTRGENADTLITSDYAAVKSDNYKGFALADATKELAEDAHLYTTAKDAIDNDPQFELVWNADSINVAELICTHVNTDACEVLKNVESKGFEYVYELLGYVEGINNTSQSAHAAMSGSWLRAQITKDGKQQAWGAEQSKATIGRMPVVRVSLIESANRNVVAVGYVKFEIVAEGAEIPVGQTDVFTYNFTDAYRPDCGASIQHILNWYQVEETIYTKLGLSKTEFEADFELDGFDATNNTPATQYESTAYDAAAVAAAETIGQVVRTTRDIEGNMTEVLLWTVSDAQAFELLQNNNSVKVNVRFKKDNGNGTYHYAYVTFNWTPSSKYVNPTGSIDNSTKLDEAWFAADSPEAGFDEVHFSVQTPTTATDNNPANCIFERNIREVFIGEKVLVTLSDETNYPGFADNKLVKAFYFDIPANTEAVGNDGNTYILSSADGVNLVATQKDNRSNYATIATLTNGTNSPYSNDSLSYQKNDIAKALLNEYDHTDLGDKETLTARVKFVAEDECGRELKIENNTFDVRFLRPLSILSKNADQLQDGVDGWSTIKLVDVLEFTDWREYKLADAGKEHLFRFYGITNIAIDEEEVRVVVNGTEEKLKDRYPSVQIDYTEATSLSVSDLGTFGWRNNQGITLSQDVTLKLPVTVTYVWGTIKQWIPVTVKKTIGQN